MGYRSDVALVLTKEGVDKLLIAINEIKDETVKDKTLELLNNCDSHYTDESGAEAWFWEWIKWYPEYPPVDFITNFIYDLEDEDYLLIILGEEMKDIEEEGEFYDNPFDIYLSRSIHLPN